MSIQIKGKTINSGVGFGKILIKKSFSSDKTATFSKNDEIFGDKLTEIKSILEL